jgi:predicted RNA-binding protein associated with RNAse of E/G family
MSEAYPGTSALRLARPGASHSILLFFRVEFYAWYVNLERPLMRSPVGFDLSDLFLDVYIERDRPARWLDEDELEQALAAGLLTPEDAAAARAEGERVLAEWPFPTGWEDFRPDPRWEPPQLPAGWDVV